MKVSSYCKFGILVACLSAKCLAAPAVPCLKYTPSKSCADKCGAYADAQSDCATWYTCALLGSDCDDYGGQEKRTGLFEASYIFPRTQAKPVELGETGFRRAAQSLTICSTTKPCIVCEYSDVLGRARCSPDSDLETQCYLYEDTLNGTPCP